jgi:hypothetical protein
MHNPGVGVPHSVPSAAERALRNPDDQQAQAAVEAAWAAHRADLAERWVRHLVSTAPRLTAAQRDRIAHLLRATPEDDGGQAA